MYYITYMWNLFQYDLRSSSTRDRACWTSLFFSRKALPRGCHPEQEPRPLLLPSSKSVQLAAPENVNVSFAPSLSFFLSAPFLFPGPTATEWLSMTSGSGSGWASPNTAWRGNPDARNGDVPKLCEKMVQTWKAWQALKRILPNKVLIQIVFRFLGGFVWFLHGASWLCTGYTNTETVYLQ